ncbi:ashwin-like [Macrosteles quadrilineatus]|uniref:ashwin-like n=1 Tax=Macrosteles quadrilineatus TaxID=74068 RepID=UPI0023E12D39|nr:ashwin-like [Macrosteles quadrilineatus]
MDKPENNTRNASQSVLKLIQPELLSVEELENILKERSVPSSKLPQSKDELVSLFKTVAFPLPQREFRENYRGLMQSRKKAERKRICLASVSEHKSFTFGVNEASSSTRHPIEQKSDRLKPPPDSINHERKKIRLSSNNSTDLDKIVIKKRKPSERSDSVEDKQYCLTNHQPENERLSSTTSEDKSSDSCNGSKISRPKKISLKRNHLVSTSSISSCESTPEKSPSEPDKKRKLITWP